MSDAPWIRVLTGPVSVAVNCLLDTHSVAQPAAEWIQLPGVSGSTVLIKNGRNEAVTLTSTSKVNTWNCQVREVTSSSGAVIVGVGHAPPLQITGADGANGTVPSVSLLLAADGAASDLVVETKVAPIVAAGTADFFILSAGVAAASNTLYATLTMRLYRGGSAVKTWTRVTKIAGTGFTGTWADGSWFTSLDPFAVLPGDYCTIQQAKASTGTQLPAHWVGLVVT